MTEANHEGVSVDYACALAGKTVLIDRTYTLRVSRTGKRMGRALSAVDCSNKDHCVVASHTADGTVYDWSRCIFLHPPAP